jgi:hypothetical protein
VSSFARSALGRCEQKAHIIPAAVLVTSDRMRNDLAGLGQDPEVGVGPGVLVAVRSDGAPIETLRWPRHRVVCRPVCKACPLMSKAPISCSLALDLKGIDPPHETIASPAFFPASTQAGLAPRGPLRFQKSRPLRCSATLRPKRGFIAVALPFAVSPSQGIGPSRTTEEDRP